MKKFESIKNFKVVDSAEALRIKGGIGNVSHTSTKSSSKGSSADSDVCTDIKGVLQSDCKYTEIDND